MKPYPFTNTPDRLVLNSQNRINVPLDEIMLLKGNVNYTIIVLADGEEKEVSYTLKFFLPFLESHGFQRVHKRSIINPKYIKDYDARLGVITMSNEMSVQVSRRQKEKFMKKNKSSLLKNR
jgi:DNA-binding LytR/AlgR family response regulator